MAARLILTTKDVADEYGIPVGTLRYWRSRNEGPPSFTLGRRKVVYKRTELESWLESQQEASLRGGVA